MAFIIKQDTLLTDGFVRSSDQVIIPSANVTIKTELDNPIMVDEVEILKLIAEAAQSGQKEVFQTDDFTVMTTTYDAFIKANTIYTPVLGDVSTIAYNGTDPDFVNSSESYTYDSTNWILITSNLNIISSILLLDLKITNLENGKVSKTVADDKYLGRDSLDGATTEMKNGYGNLNSNAIVIHRQLNESQEVINADLLALKIDADQHLKLQDIPGTITITFSELTPFENGDDIEINLSGIDTTGYTDSNFTSLIMIKAGDINTLNLSDYWNDANSNPGIIYGTPVTISLLPAKCIITGLSEANRTLFISEYKATSLIQIQEQVGANVDQVARDNITSQGLTKQDKSAPTLPTVAKTIEGGIAENHTDNTGTRVITDQNTARLTEVETGLEFVDVPDYTTRIFTDADSFKIARISDSSGRAFKGICNYHTLVFYCASSSMVSGLSNEETLILEWNQASTSHSADVKKTTLNANHNIISINYSPILNFQLSNKPIGPGSGAAGGDNTFASGEQTPNMSIGTNGPDDLVQFKHTDPIQQEVTNNTNAIIQNTNDIASLDPPINKKDFDMQGITSGAGFDEFVSSPAGTAVDLKTFDMNNTNSSVFTTNNNYRSDGNYGKPVFDKTIIDINDGSTIVLMITHTFNAQTITLKVTLVDGSINTEIVALTQTANHEAFTHKNYVDTVIAFATTPLENNKQDKSDATLTPVTGTPIVNDSIINNFNKITALEDNPVSFEDWTSRLNFVSGITTKGDIFNVYGNDDKGDRGFIDAFATGITSIASIDYNTYLNGGNWKNHSTNGTPYFFIQIVSKSNTTIRLLVWYYYQNARYSMILEGIENSIDTLFVERLGHDGLHSNATIGYINETVINRIEAVEDEIIRTHSFDETGFNFVGATQHGVWTHFGGYDTGSRLDLAAFDSTPTNIWSQIDMTPTDFASSGHHGKPVFWNAEVIENTGTQIKIKVVVWFKEEIYTFYIFGIENSNLHSILYNSWDISKKNTLPTLAQMRQTFVKQHATNPADFSTIEEWEQICADGHWCIFTIGSETVTGIRTADSGTNRKLKGFVWDSTDTVYSHNITLSNLLVLSVANKIPINNEMETIDPLTYGFTNANDSGKRVQIITTTGEEINGILQWSNTNTPFIKKVYTSTIATETAGIWRGDKTDKSTLDTTLETYGSGGNKLITEDDLSIAFFHMSKKEVL